MGGKSRAPAPPPVDTTPEVAPPVFTFAPPAASGPSASELAAQQAKAQQEAEERARIQAGEQERDSLYSDYINAASSATDFINQEISDERSNANLMGIEFNVTDEQKSNRISNYFASIWGEGDQTRLQGLFDEFGETKGFDGFNITRGDASQIKGAGTPSETTVSSSNRRGTLATAADEEDTLGTTSLLGG